LSPSAQQLHDFLLEMKPKRRKATGSAQ
jgi:hypothetical protein